MLTSPDPVPTELTAPGAIRLGANQYGKAEVRLVTVSREPDAHHLRDLTISTALRGDLADTHLTGDNTKVLTTDTQKNTVYALAGQQPVGEIEEFALRLGRHFVATQAAIDQARVLVDEHHWRRVAVAGQPHPHAFARGGGETRTTAVTVAAGQAWVVSGLRDLVLLKTAGSEFHGFPRDRYTTLPETTDRVLATSVTARWRYQHLDVAWRAAFEEVRACLVGVFADQHSRSLQQTLYAMGEAVLAARPDVGEIRLSLPNRHHVPVDLTPFGLTNDNEVFVATDRPYGLIEGEVRREGASDPGLAWHTLPAF
ncbi:factor-independent urate hydroxylase [Goodfellowiella coeruleoviolacea]|uniref:Uricase n=1 Tax=Goodfellowiella coeruleoviolacea TaxID=334858 RepID=A0AAE3GDP0_9PSEU|nr:urate oxidase [Goodfellowiella coeruleoviolacea]MCP2165374.1 urate oxidase [Goodfellowiella coeruleoviolacea]